MALDSGPLKMTQDPLRDRLEASETALGVYVNSHYTVELAAHVGFDWVFIDQMFTDIGWRQTGHMIRAAEAAGITPVVRVQATPWLGYDHHVAIDVARNLGIGAKYVLVSHSGEGELAECLELAGTWQRKALHVHPFHAKGEWDEKVEELASNTHIIPQPETLASLEGLEETMRRPEVDHVFIAMSDASRVLTEGQDPEWDDPDLWEFVDRAVELGEETDTVVGANTSYAYSMDELHDRAVRLHDAGVRMIMTQGVPFLFQIAIGEYLDGVKSAIGQSD